MLVYNQLEETDFDLVDLVRLQESLNSYFEGSTFKRPQPAGSLLHGVKEVEENESTVPVHFLPHYDESGYRTSSTGFHESFDVCLRELHSRILSSPKHRFSKSISEKPQEVPYPMRSQI